MHSNPYWAVAKAKPSLEKFAAEHVKRQGHEYYLPLMQETVVDKRGWKTFQVRPLFPRYLFIRIVDRWRHLQGTRGLTGLILSGDAPARLDDNYILELKSRENAEGVVILPSEEDARRFTQGQEVHVTSGLFAGEIGIFDGSSAHERERVLINILGRKVSVLIASAALEAVA